MSKEEAIHTQLVELQRDHQAVLSENERLRAALMQSITAIDDWLNDYASDLCDEASVAETRKRLYEYGTIAYIATVQQRNREALALTPHYQQDDSK